MICGIILIVVGVFIRLWAILSMNGKFSFKIKMPDKLCKTGAYKYVRHPSYVGSWLMLFGISLLHPAAGVGYLAFAFFLARATQEEMILSQLPEYLQYRKQTGMFIPKVNHGNSNTRTK